MCTCHESLTKLTVFKNMMFCLKRKYITYKNEDKKSKEYKEILMTGTRNTETSTKRKITPRKDEQFEQTKTTQM